MGTDDSEQSEVERLKNAIRKHRDQKADDRCWMDDRELYAVLGDGDLGDNTTCDIDVMLANCQRYITNRMQGGDWKSYQELEEENQRLTVELDAVRAELDVVNSRL